MITQYPYILVRRESVKGKSLTGFEISGGDDEPTGKIVGCAEDGGYDMGEIVAYDPSGAREIWLQGQKLLLMKEDNIVTTDL